MGISRSENLKGEEESARGGAWGRAFEMERSAGRRPLKQLRAWAVEELKGGQCSSS